MFKSSFENYAIASLGIAVFLAGVVALCAIFVEEAKALASSATPEPKKEVVKEQPAFDFQGIYECQGKQDGETYDGIVVIRKTRSVYLVQWSIGGNTFMGIGQRTGDVLSVGWAQQQKEGVVRGVTVYTKGKDGAIEGSWVSLPGNGEKHRETLTLLKKIVEKE